MTSWLGGIISKLSPRKSVSLTNLSEDATDTLAQVENIEPDHRTTEYIEIRERITRPASKVNRRRRSSSQKNVSLPSEKAWPSSAPIKRRLSELLLREKSPARRFLATGLEMLTRSGTLSQPMSSAEDSDSDSNHELQQDQEEEEETLEGLCNDLEQNYLPYPGYKARSKLPEVARRHLFQESTFEAGQEVEFHDTARDPASERVVYCVTPADEVLAEDRPPPMEMAVARNLRPRSISPQRKPLQEVPKRKRGPNFSATEEEEIVDYLLTQGGYGARGGNTVWKKMEEAGVGRPRTWQSLKQRFLAYVCQDLQQFGVTERQLLAAPALEAEVIDYNESVDSQLHETAEASEDEEVDKQYKEVPKQFGSDPSEGERVDGANLLIAASEADHDYSGAVPGSPVYQCQVLADQQAELLSEIRQLSDGVSVSRLALPGTRRKQRPQEGTNNKLAKTVVKTVKCSEVLQKPKPTESLLIDIPVDMYKVKRRTPYSAMEEREMINYLLEYGGFLTRGGNVLWQRMEQSAMVCPGRTWQSLKQRFNKFTYKNLSLFGVKKHDLIEGGGWSSISPAAAVIPAPNYEESSFKRRKRGPPFSKEEERAMISFFLARGGFSQRGGTTVWREMEQARTCPGRTWQSLKQRFNMYVHNNLEKFNVTKTALMGVTDLVEITATDVPEPEKQKGLPEVEDEVLKVPLRGLTGCKSRYRKAYNQGEEQSIVTYLQKEGGYGSRGGDALWKRMEEGGVCPGRSWQSMKARYAKAIRDNLGSFGTSEQALIDADQPKEITNTTNERTDETDDIAIYNITDAGTMELIFGQPVDIEVCEPEDEANPPAALFLLEHDNSELPELDLLTMELNNEQPLAARIAEKAKFAGNIYPTSNRSRGGTNIANTSPNTFVSIDGIKKRKAQTQELPDSSPKKKRKINHSVPVVPK